MGQEIRQARGQVAAMIAQEKELAADKAEADRVSAEWQRRAELAVDQGRDDLAREALRRKRDSDENARVYAEQLTAQQQTVSRLKNQLQELETKSRQAESKRDALIARSRRAKAQQQVSETMSNLPESSASAEFERFERRIRTTEAKAAASEELAQVGFDDDFAELDQDFGVDDELAALKASRGGSSAGATTSGASTGSSGGGSSEMDDELARLKAQRGPAATGGSAGSMGSGDTSQETTSDWSPSTPGSPSSQGGDR
jgi:phage shock protein A